MAFTAKDVAALRAATGVGMMDCKKALEATDGDVDAAITHLREKGLTKAAERADRENNQGAVALVVDGNVGAHRAAQVRDRLRGRLRHVQGAGPGPRRARRRQGRGRGRPSGPRTSRT